MARAQAGPNYQVDPFWPKRLPNKSSMQQIVDIYVDKEDHIWMLNRGVDARPDELGASRNSARQESCVLGPEVIEFSQDGTVLRAWGGSNYVPGWPGRLQTLGVDRDENVWISGTPPGDSIICTGSMQSPWSRREMSIRAKWKTANGFKSSSL